MLTVLSLVTSVKDYIEIAHKLIESQSGNLLFSDSILNSGTPETQGFGIFKDYTEFGAVLTYLVLSIKEFLTSLLTFNWLNKIWSLPLIVPDIASAMISEVSVLDNYFTNAFSFLETGSSLVSGSTNGVAAVNSENGILYGFEKFFTGFLNSFFLFLPTSTAHLITLRRFVIQGLEAGYIAGLGTIAGNFLWLASIILGWRFIVIPWLSLDIFRYILGFSLLVKYLWDSSKDLNKAGGNTKLAEDDWNSKKSIFVLNFLLALTEQTSIYPFISNLSFGAEGSILESFSGKIFQSYVPDAHSLEFIAIHGCYLAGILLGSLSLLHFTVWFWENPAFSIYMWMITSYRVSTSSYYKVLNFVFLYLTMLCAISSIPYFGLDYTVTNPLGLIPQDRIINQKFTTANGPGEKILPETAFLNGNPTDKNSRIRDGLHARRERWKERLIKYQAFDASVYDQGNYDILTIEDLNYGFDRFWLRRKMRNHQIRFRLFPGPWMRSLKKQAQGGNTAKSQGFSGPRVEFFRILFEQYYHPIFHSTISTSKNSSTKLNKGFQTNKNTNSSNKTTADANLKGLASFPVGSGSLYSTVDNSGSSQASRAEIILKKGLILNSSGSSSVLGTDNISDNNSSALRKFSRNFNNRVNSSVVNSATGNNYLNSSAYSQDNKIIYSKSLKSLYNQIGKDYSKEKQQIFRNISRNLLSSEKIVNNLPGNVKLTAIGKNFSWSKGTGVDNLGTNSEKSIVKWDGLKKQYIRKKLSKQEKLVLTYKTLWAENSLHEGLLSPTYSDANIAMVAKAQVLKPLNIYLKKDDALKRKFKYYSTVVGRNLNVGDNAPYLKTMLKRAFYYHKPSLRWKRTMFTAAMRRGFRKKSGTPKKLLYTTNALTINSIPDNKTIGQPSSNMQDGFSAGFSKQTMAEGYNQVDSAEPNIYKKTASYSVLGKRASRYRYQIYRDVLQHWYYSPFNRLLLKFDIDSFINRQPKSHFVTKKEERLLHLRRILLSEHYNSLRWYTYMQHYRTMKSRIGSTKSFASTAYNQQFQGTFKKIRHLFAITPAQGDMPTLKFDQLLYNNKNLDVAISPYGSQEQSTNLENSNSLSANSTSSISNAASSNSSKKLFREGITKQNLLSSGPYIHEENLAYTASDRKDSNKIESFGNNKVSKEDLINQSLLVTGELIKNQTLKQNSGEEKIIGSFSDYIKEKNYSQLSRILDNSLNMENSSSTNVSQQQTNKETKQILLRLLKECKRRLNDQAFFKQYITHRIEKREQRNNDAQTDLAKQLQSLQTWLSPILIQTENSNSVGTQSSQAYARGELTSNSVINPQKGIAPSTGIRKALNEGVFVLNNLNPSTSSKNLKIWSKEISTLKYNLTNSSSQKPNYYISSLAALEQEKNIKQTLMAIKYLDKKTENSAVNQNSKLLNFGASILKTKEIIRTSLTPLFWVQHQFLIKKNQKTIEWWKQKQRVITKRKSSIQKFKRLDDLLKEKTELETKVSQKLNPTTPGETLEKVQKIRSNLKDKSRRELSLTTKLLASPTTSILDQDNLRKKIDNSTNNQIITSTEKSSLKKIFENFIFRKFKSRNSVKGSRYKIYRSRDFVQISRPKYANNFSIIDNTGAMGNIGVLTKDEKRIRLQEFKTKLLYGRKGNNSETLGQTSFATAGSDSKKENAKIILRKLNSQTIKDLLNKNNIKVSPINKRSKHKWRKRKQKFTRNQLKYTKRRIHALGKLRNLNKKFKRIQATQELQNWWWNNYLPNYIATKKPNLEGNTKIMAKGRINTEMENLASANQNYKPLSTSEALDIRQKLLNYTGGATTGRSPYSFPGGNISNSSTTEGTQTTVAQQSAQNLDSQTNNQNILDQLYTNLLENNNSSIDLYKNTTKAAVQSTTNLPFYAGWDESLRKFVVTNRLLSRRDTGFNFVGGDSSLLNAGMSNLSPAAAELKKKQNNSQDAFAKFDFTNAPIQGLNEGSFLYLQTDMPFNSYVIDQFIPNNQSFYAPLGWKRFQFRHSLLKNWFNSINYFAPGMQAFGGAEAAVFPLGSQIRRVSKNFYLFAPSGSYNQNNLAQAGNVILGNKAYGLDKKTLLLKNKRIKKRYKLLKQTPIQLMYVPTGALLTELLPSHYVSVFDKQYRNPRNRYLKRFLPKADKKTITQNSGQGNKEILDNTNIRELALLEFSNSPNASSLDFTLRQKIKPRRKYHKKRSIWSKKEGLIFPRRTKFNTNLIAGVNNSTDINNMTSGTEVFRLRPSTKAKQPGAKKVSSKKRLPKTMRVRQLRNREFKQVYKPLQRFEPSYGGFVWPGDYLRLEVFPMPKLESLKVLNNSSANALSTAVDQYGQDTNKIAEGGIKNKLIPAGKTKINIQPVGLLPRKYLLEKHNIKVLKKKLALNNL